MLADVFRMPNRTAVSAEGPALGAAVLAAVGAGLFPSVEIACERMVRYNDALEPVAEQSEAYEPFYGLYTRLYPALRESYKELAKL
jgi:xylulokinase